MNTQSEIILRYYKKSRYERGKHGDYITPPDAVRLYFKSQYDFGADTRAENARMAYILKHVDFRNKNVLDIGGNTAFFSFAALGQGARKVSYIDGSAELCAVAQASAALLGATDSFQIENGYFDPRGIVSKDASIFDIAFLLNVVHHLGDDFGEKQLTISAAKESMLDYINAMSRCCNILVFQMGFTWMGDSFKPLFDKGNMVEMIRYIEEGTQGYFKLSSCGVPIYYGDLLKEYKDHTYSCLARNYNAREFFNRPIMILESVSRRE